ncbi:hypothetical protein [Ligilactobacillus acidipiscis]|uniref:hypothetical protein n=1 Tax=Ligilactobacillus acidipiscis TaxID=89059 RepID=UPI0022E3D48D|nr:hypothetical protein [Ligilactobacillus acidipiscis]
MIFKKNYSFTLKPQVKKLLEKEAEEQDPPLTTSSYLELLLEEHFKRQNKLD